MTSSMAVSGSLLHRTPHLYSTQALGLLGASFLYGTLAASAPQTGFWRAALFSGTAHALAALLAIPVFLRVRRTPWPSSFQIGFVVKHGLAALAYSACWTAAILIAIALLEGGTPFIARYWMANVPWHLPHGLFLYSLAASAGFARQTGTRVEALEADLLRVRTEARALALRSPMEPHFLFNALNVISDLVAHDPRAADLAIDRLGTLLRRLVNTDADRIPVSEEVDRVQDYTFLEQLRFGPRLQITWNVATDAMDGLLPCFAVQVLVENAIRHGGFDEGCRVMVDIVRNAGTLSIHVADSGSGQPPFIPGVGLRNLGERLALYYGRSASLSFASVQDGRGVVAQLRLPYEDETGAEHDE